MFDHLTNAELRLELAEAEYQRPKTIKGVCHKKGRIRHITAALCARGAF